MGRLGFVIVGGLLLVSTSAFAQSSGPSVRITDETSANTFIYPGSFCTSCIEGGFSFPGIAGPGAGSASFPNPTLGTSTSGKAMWNSFVDTTTNPALITFESSNTASGSVIETDSFSTVALALSNGSGLNLHSTITPAGMGFYVADIGADGSCILTGTCRQVAAGSAYDFAAFAAAPGDLFAGVGFDFNVYTSAAGFDDHTLYSVHASLELNEDGSLIILEDLGQGFEKLSNFGLQTPPAGGGIPYHSLGYNWGQTDFEVGGLFETSFQTIYYQTSVYSNVSAPCLSGGTGVDAGVTACLIAYSGFGDPIGRGVSELSVADLGSSSVLGGIGIFNHSDDDLIEGLHFSSFSIDTPRIVGNTLVVGTDAVPEPAAWAMMILGFGSIGAVMRRRRMVEVRA